MAYQVLARKWRPKNFEQLVGQEHVVTVLVNALMQERLHHAYLFTGTRGVGKTTIARIFAKSLNCETGITATPCGQCDTCVDIDQGKFIDLLEIDAASRTKVDDTREILDNVQYAPTRGRYKVYLIDEVHMLSRSSFNALLKTLEEPPAHVKFILATTDPQKLPVTVLSRCLQFHLKALTNAQISTKLTEILSAEEVDVEDGCLKLLAKAARGSMRDSLSLTDQAISQGSGSLTVSNIQQMLGGVDQNWPFKILVALAKKDNEGLMSLSLEIASYSPNYGRLIAELLQLLHQIALSQVINQYFDMTPEQEIVFGKLTQAMSPEDVQLYYQISLNARKDLPYVGDEQAAMDMLLLRLLSFQPMVRPNKQVEQIASASSINDFNEDALTSSLTKNEETQAPSLDLNEKSNAAKEQVSIAEQIEPINDEPLNGEQSTLQSGIQEQNEVENPEPINTAPLNSESVNSAPLINDLDAGLPDELTGHIRSESGPVPNLDNTSSNDNDDIVAKMNDEQEHLENIANEAAQSLSSVQESDDAVSEQQPEIQEAQQISQPAPQQVEYNSPLEAALATRNMLRSRKKQMENESKKSDGVAGRQVDNTEASPKAESLANKKPDVPDITSVPDQPFTPDIIDPTTIKKASQVDKWANMIDAMDLTARIRQLAIHATIDEQSTDEVLKLKLDQATKHLVSDTAHKQLEKRISLYLSKPITVEVEIVEQTIADPYQIQSTINDKRLDYAISIIKDDPLVNKFIQDFQAELVVESITAR